jgi:hypothetical protein
MKMQLILLAVLTAALTSTASAAPSFVIKRDNDIGGFVLARNGKISGAIAVYGNPTSRQQFGYDECTVVWAELGVQSTFSHSYDNPCSLSGCHLETAITGRQWRTDRGLRVGDSLRRLRKLYPSAKVFVGKRWSLITRPFGGTRVPTLLATVEAKRITSLTVRSPWLLVC